jgi:hypothetical protein
MSGLDPIEIRSRDARSLVPAARAARSRCPNLEGPALDLQGMAPGKGQGNLAAGPRDDALKGRAGHTHPISRLMLSEAFKVGQAQGFQLFLEEGDAAKPVERHAGRLVDSRSGHAVE